MALGGWDDNLENSFALMEYNNRRKALSQIVSLVASLFPYGLESHRDAVARWMRLGRDFR